MCKGGAAGGWLCLGFKIVCKVLEKDVLGCFGHIGLMV